MTNELLSLAIAELKKKKYDAYFISISNENIYEFTRPIDNYIVDLTGFSGDTGALLVTKDKSYLYIDGRFTIQAKREVKDKRIKIVEINRIEKRIDDILIHLNKKSKIAFNPKKVPCSYLMKAKEKLELNGLSLILDDNFLKKEFSKIKQNCFNLSKAPLFVLDEKYVSKSAKLKIKECLDSLRTQINENGDIYYVTSSLEEIAYLSNIRYRLCDIDNHGVLFDAFMIVGKNKTYLYIKDYIEDKYLKLIQKSNLEIKDYEDFYKDLRKIKEKSKYYFDKAINNYYIYDCLKIKNNKNIINSPLTIEMSIKGNTEIKCLRKCNILDGVAMTKVIYKLKNEKLSSNNFKNEYDIKKYVDKKRVEIGKKEYLCPSFETIVAYKDNSAICHYTPTKNKNKKISNSGLLLIDSGGNYLTGTTDITRTISLYNKKVPSILKKHYTLVLESMISLTRLKFPYGLTGFELDIIARKTLYDEYMDFNHGTGHGIGYISNVHEGPNRIGPIVSANYEKNVLMPYQVTSNEPGLYFENKYGIRIENDLLTIELKENEFGSFMGFETLTLCPFDRDLIDKKYLSSESIKFLNNYNELIYKKLSKYLSHSEKIWLKKVTKEV